jgi:superfamily II DNA or RNA helicase
VIEPRGWQQDALDLVIPAIKAGGAATVSAAPGAGKTVFGGLVFRALREAGVVERMVAIVPRRGLADQWAESLAANCGVQLKPHAAQERRGQDGCVVTYQSLQNTDALDTHRARAEHKPTLLILDEVHHVGERPDGRLPTWARNVAELAGDVEAHDLHVPAVLNLSGTLWRSAPGERISTVRYAPTADGRLQSRVDYEIGVAELVAAGQLRPLDLYRLGARVTLTDYQSLEHVEGNLSDLDEKPARAAMRALSSIDTWRTAFVASVLDRLKIAHRALEGHHVKALIVAARQEDAAAFRDEVDRQMVADGLRPLASLAISDVPDAQRTLEDFRAQPRVGVLCTVDMAGEGYDCPDIAVIGYASSKLTSLYVRQATARAMRVTAKERELGYVIPAAVVIPDATELVTQMVSYLAPFTHEVLVPEAGDTEDGGGEGEAGPRLFPLPRFSLEDAAPAGDDTVTVPYADGSHEDIDAEIARRLAQELERLNVPGIYAPRAVAASRRTIGDLLDSRPFETPSADASVLAKLATGAEAVAAAEAEPRRSNTIEGKASILMSQLDAWARWVASQRDPEHPVAHFNRSMNQAGGIPDKGRGSASIDQLKKARDWGRQYINDYCRSTGRRPPRGFAISTDDDG